jgi:hypothetical protein
LRYPDLSSRPYQRTPGEQEKIDEFIEAHFKRDPQSFILSPEEQNEVSEILDVVEALFGGKKYILGLAIDFLCVAESIGEAVDPEISRRYEPDLSSESIFQRYDRMTKRYGRDLNTLTFLDDTETEHGIRAVENAIVTLYHDGLDRLNYPSSAPYATGQWSSYEKLLTRCFRLSDAGRRVAVQNLLTIGLARLERTESFRGNPRERLFPLVISDYPRNSIGGENAGAIFQGLVYGYVRADRPHLSTMVSKVRTGSSRQRRIGDIDCYKDLNVELSIEVKDRDLTLANWQGEIGTFRKNVMLGDILGIALVRSITDAARTAVEGDRMIVMTQEELLEEVRRWDWPKQDGALRDLLHYLAHIEQNPDSVRRLQRFIQRHDPEHDVLRDFTESEGSSAREEPPRT